MNIHLRRTAAVAALSFLLGAPAGAQTVGGVTLSTLNATDKVELTQSTGPQHQFATLTTLANYLRQFGTQVLSVALGGTGAASLTAHGVLLGEGTSAITPTAAMTNGQLLVGATGADPAPQTMSQDCTITAAGVITCTKTNNVALTSAATTALGTSGATIPLLSTANTWTLGQTFTAAQVPTGGIGAAGGFAISPRNVVTCNGAGRDAAGALTDQTPNNTEVYIAEVFVPANMTVTGVAVFNGSVASGNMKVGLANSSGAVVATSGSTAASGTQVYQRVPFTGTYAAVGPATYYVLTFYDNNTQRANALKMGNCGAAKQTGQVYATGFTTITPPTTFTADLGPAATLY